MDHPSCIICSATKHSYLYTVHKTRLWQCDECGLISSFPHSSSEDILTFYGNDANPDAIWTESITELEASKRYLEFLKKRAGDNIKVLLIAPSDHVFARLAETSGIKIDRHVGIQEFEKTSKDFTTVDAVVFLYQLEKCVSPDRVLEQAYDVIKPGGFVFVVTPSLDSFSARFLGTHWTEWRPENKYYFDGNTIQSLQLKYGFNSIELYKDRRWYSIEHINERATNFPNTWITRSIRLLYGILPSFLHAWHFRLPSSGMMVSAQKGERRARPLLSIVMPVYNESATFPAIMEQLVSKQFEKIDREIIVVESNSSDNSRELVLQYKDKPNIKIILQNKARGKGNAVREGFEHAKGDILLIQDADLEYDLDDYEALLEPVATFKRPFVLGSRHGGRWKMRHFNDQQQLSAYFNFGHVLFTFLINLLYWQRMKDPFTMFKVFRRDCLYNLRFECDRFDFDFELVIKLIRKGYIPLEIPVNYDSRSFKEGKKVQMFRDPITWIRALIKYRFAKITKE
jgi:SAM-dependent methyltransferase